MTAPDARYSDAFGVERVVPQATLDAFVALLGGEAHAEDMLLPATVVRDDRPAAVEITLPAASWTERVSWTIALEDGSARHGTAELRDAPVTGSFERMGRTFDRRSLALGAFPLGYHRIALDAGRYGSAESFLVIVPPAVYTPPGGQRWGIAVQVYTLRSERNWGIGDFTDLTQFIRIAAEAGADYVGVNPLHAPHRTDPDAASPYAPTSRRFLNWLYIDVDALAQSHDPRVRSTIDAPDFQAQLQLLRATSIVDYIGVAAAKDIILRACFALVHEHGRDDAEFSAFIADGGTALERFATFETLVERFGRDVAAWPPSYRDPATDDVKAFARAERPAVEYSMFLQYHAARQLSAAAKVAQRHAVAIYRDLAVGVDASGADVWIDPQAYVSSVSVGAPPDMLNPDGQDWGLPPLHPTGLARDGYRTAAELFRANMQDAGALRIDHVMSLARLFWSPRGRSALEGTYVGYPFEDVLGVLALESVRARCSVIGEDLGTVPVGFRERMAQAHVLSYRILFFERQADANFIIAEQYPALSLAAIGTHDLATFAAWIGGSDIDLRASLGVGDPARIADEHVERETDRQRLVALLVASGDLAGADASPADVMIAAHRFLARSPARIVMMQVDDALGEVLPINVPGTWDQYPNWRRKLGLDIETIAAEPQFIAVCDELRESRPRGA